MNDLLFCFSLNQKHMFSYENDTEKIILYRYWGYYFVCTS